MDIEMFKPLMDVKWYEMLKGELGSATMQNTFDTLKELKSQGKNIYPQTEDCFNAFKYCKWDDVRVVILGQDPYHTPGVAHGLAFSSAQEDYVPPSLRNIFKEIGIDRSPNLTDWAEQGVLLLNTALTVEESNAGSHLELWESFTTEVLTRLSEYKTGVIYVLWGGKAQAYERYIGDKNHILKAVHPSPLSAYRGFFGCDHFNKINTLILKMNGEEINW